MDIKGRVKNDTRAFKNIMVETSGDTITAGTDIHIVGIKRYGIKSFYELDDGSFVESKNITVIRDNGFYYENYKTKMLQKNNIAMATGKGLSYALDTLGNEYTSSYFDLQRFAGFDLGGFTEIPGTVGGGFGGAINQSNTGGIPTVGGGYGGGIISTVNPMDSSDNIAGTELNDILGIENDNVSNALAGASISSLFDGSFLGIVGGNLLNMLGGMFGGKLKFVIGFAFAAAGINSNFMSKWSRAIRGLNISSPGMGFMRGLNGLGIGETQQGTTTGSWTGSIGDTISRPNVYITYYGTGGSVIQNQIEQKQLPLTPVNQNFKNYFSYYVPLEGDLLSSRQLMAIADTRYQFMEDYHTGTATSKPSEIETSFIQRVSNATYNEFKSAINVVRDEFNLDIDRETTFVKFNRFRVPTPNNELGMTRGHVFFTAPDMNLNMYKEVGSTSKIRTRIENSATAAPFMTNMLKCHPVLTKFLMGKDGRGNHNMIPILSHCCTGLDISDELIETVEAHESYTGWKVIYGKSNIKSRTAGTINVAFTDDNMLSIYKILKIWIEYISAVYRGEASPFRVYADTHVLDYAISIYYFLCKENDEDILFWCKYTGCFPTAAPASNFSDTIDKQIARPSYTVPFSFAKKDDYNPIDIYEFNQLTKGDAYAYIPTYNEKTMHVHKSFVGAPFVDTLDGTQLFKLRFRKG